MEMSRVQLGQFDELIKSKGISVQVLERLRRRYARLYSPDGHKEGCWIDLKRIAKISEFCKEVWYNWWVTDDWIRMAVKSAIRNLAYEANQDIEFRMIEGEEELRFLY